MKCLLAVITLFSWIGVAVSVPCPIPDFYNEDFEPFRSQSKTEFRTKRRLFLRCKEAYVKDSGTNWIVCQSNGEWRNYGQLQCKLRSCRLPDHTSLPHGDYEIDDNGDFTVGQRMRITCDDGYEMDTLNGSPWRRCMANGEINYEWPRCEPKRCSKPAIDDKMEVSLSIVDNWDFHHGDSVYVKCPGGYDVTGTRKSNDHIFCKSGSWSKEFKCEEKTCQDPDIIDGYVEKSASNDEKCEEKWFSGCQADVKCVEGAAVRNYEDRTIVCSSDGFWDNVPQCYKYCTSDSITNGYLENYRRERVIKNGQTGTYHCDWGYKRNTDYNEVKCMFSVVHVRSWSGSWYRDYEYNDAPSCKPKPTELRRADGTLYYNSADDSRISGYSTDLEHDTGVRMECDSGYQIPEGYVSGQSVYFRAYFGEWKYQFNEQSRNDTNQPKCEEAPCQVPTNDHTYYKDSDSDKYGEIVIEERESRTYIYAYCESDDYELVEVNNYDRIDRTDRNRMYCSTGSWNRHVRCREKSCNFANPDRKTLRLSGVVEEEGYKLHDRDMTIVCAEGYEFERGVGEQYVKCQYGKWKDDNGREVTTECTAKPCVVPSNAFTFYKKSQGGESITGYRQSGDSIYVSCESDDYERVEVIDNGDMERTTQDMMYCRTGNWNLQLKCREKSCPIDDKRNLLGQNGRDIELDYFNHDSSLAIKCGDGYQFINQDNVTSMRIKCDHGTWLRGNTKVTPSCTAKPCDVPSNGFTYYSEYKNGVSFTGHRESGYSIYVRCESDNYEVVEINDNGKMERTEQNAMRCRRGNWITQLKCHEKSCPIDGTEKILRGINNGTIHADHFQHNEGLAIKCVEGHQFVEQEDVTSMNIECYYGRWRTSQNQDEVIPSCVEKMCSVPTHTHTHYTVNGGNVASGDYVGVTCSKGYELEEGIGTSTMFCEQGSWRVEKWCQAATCKVPNQDGTQFKEGDSTIGGGYKHHGATVVVSCSEGYSLEGGRNTMNVTCQYGDWKNNQGQNIDRFCMQGSCYFSNPNNKTLRLNNNVENEGYKTHDKDLFIKCASGYEFTRDVYTDQYLSETMDIRCQYGDWMNDNGDEHKVSTECTEKSCYANPPKGGTLIAGLKAIESLTWFGHGFSDLKLMCDNGFKTENDREWVRPVCAFGNWEFFVSRKPIQNLRCYPGDSSWCVLPPNDTYTWLSYTTNTTSSNYTADTQDDEFIVGNMSDTVRITDRIVDIPDGAEVTYTCVNMSTHNASITCNNGTWDELPNCTTGCADSPCKNGGTCKDKEDGGYECVCDPWQYYGVNCERTRECVSSPCQNSGTCEDLDNGGYKCHCDPLEYYGVNCEKPLETDDLCSRNKIITPEEIVLYGYHDSDLTSMINGTSLEYDKWYKRMCSKYIAFELKCSKTSRSSIKHEGIC